MLSHEGSKHARTHSVGNYNKSFDLKKEQNCSGVVMHNFLYEKMPYTMTVAATENVRVFLHHFNTIQLYEYKLYLCANFYDTPLI